MASKVGWGSPLEIVGLSKRVTIRGVALEIHTAIRTSSPRPLQGIHERSSADTLAGHRHGALTDSNGVPAYTNCCDLSAKTINLYVKLARPSKLYVEVDRLGGEITAVRVGGHTIAVSQGTMTVPG